MPNRWGSPPVTQHVRGRLNRKKATFPMVGGLERVVVRGRTTTERSALDVLARAESPELSPVAVAIGFAAPLGARRQRQDVHDGHIKIVRKGMPRPLSLVSCISRKEAQIIWTWGGRTTRWLFEQ